MPGPSLFDEIVARLPLFEDLPEDTILRLAASGFGRGLFTASVRARLRKAGFADMAALALATPTELTEIRKIGPVRLQAIRDHVLNALARIDPDARRFHAAEATRARRMDRLRRLSAEHLPRPSESRAELGWTDLAIIERRECLRALAMTASECDAVVATLVRVLLQDRAHAPVATLQRDGERSDDEACDAEARRARIRQEQDREWEDAAPNVRS